MPTKSIPAYRIHTPTGQAVVTLSNKHHYLGRHGTPESKLKYDRLITRWIAGGRKPLDKAGEAPTVGDISGRFLAWARSYYRKRGQPTSQVGIILNTLKTLDAYTTDPAAEFGPLKLKELRQTWVDSRIARVTVNRRATIIVQMFGWAAENELVSGSVWHSLKAVKAIKKGRTDVKEMDPVGPVPPEHVEASIVHMHPNVAEMVRLQLATGMRPGEVLGLKAGDIDRSGDVWVYRVGDDVNKTEHHNKSRRVYFGPKAQQLLMPRLNMTGIFDHVFRSHIKPYRPYSLSSYWQAIQDACVKAGVPRYAPNQLRHTFATMIRREKGLEASQLMLGHSKADVTQIYAERDWDKARAIAEELG